MTDDARLLLAALKALLMAWDDWYDGIPVSGELANALDQAHYAVMKAEGK